MPGENVVAVHVGLGWWGHPAVPPQATRFPYGPPTVRMLLRATSDHDADATLTEVGTDATWQQTGGPVTYDDEYNGQTVDARLETPGWTEEKHMYPMGGPSAWTAVEIAGEDGTGSHGVRPSSSLCLNVLCRTPIRILCAPLCAEAVCAQRDGPQQRGVSADQGHHAAAARVDALPSRGRLRWVDLALASACLLACVQRQHRP